MIPTKKLVSLILPLLIAIPSIISAKTLQSKQLAGPPSEFEFMRPAQAEKSATTSKTALIPVTLKETKAGNWLWNSTLAVDEQDFSFMIFADDSKNWIIEMVNPLTKQVRNIADMDINHNSTKFGIEQNTYQGEKYTFSNMDTGQWNIRIKTIGEPEQFQGFILVTSNSKYQLNSYKTNLDQIAGHTIHFVTQSTSNEKTIEALKDFNPINSAFMLVTQPNGFQQKHPMFDDGLHGDNLANDGLFGGGFKTLAAGDYTVQINTFGNNPNGTPFFRTSQHYVPVIEQTLTMNKKHVDAITISDNRLNIAIDVDNHAKSSDNRYRIIAEVWARNLSKNGSMKPVSWISTMSTANNGQLNIELDARWIAMA
ncbi:MAG: hypothetical protein JKY19_08025, partial [Alcanivoracaceae bacterium]|nr:hypothetical protein [Alcanivoracaceae bacterium]